MTTVISGKVYCGGVTYGDGDYIVYCYDPSQDKWTTLLPLPVRYFGLGQINSKLVAVGGIKKSTENISNDVYTYDERSRKWKQINPPMPTARDSPGVLSLHSALIVASGNIPSYSTAVEIFKSDTSQWYRADPLPSACCDTSLVAIGNTCYALGGFNGSSLNHAFYASIDDIFGNAVPANQTTHIGMPSSKTWNTLPNTPTYRPAATVVAGSLFAIGGLQTSKGGADMREVYIYSSSTNSWVYISDLPTPRACTVVAVLSPTEVLMIGGWNHHCVNTVYKGILHL